MPSTFPQKAIRITRKVVLTLAAVLFLPASCVAYLTIEDFVRDNRAENFCSLIKLGMSRSEVLVIGEDAPHMKHYPNEVSESQMLFTIWDNIGVAGTVCAITLTNGVVSTTRVYATLN